MTYGRDPVGGSTSTLPSSCFLRRDSLRRNSSNTKPSHTALGAVKMFYRLFLHG